MGYMLRKLLSRRERAILLFIIIPNVKRSFTAVNKYFFYLLSTTKNIFSEYYRTILMYVVTDIQLIIYKLSLLKIIII